MITLDDFRASHPMALKHAQILRLDKGKHVFHRVYAEPPTEEERLQELDKIIVCVPMISPYVKGNWFKVVLPKAWQEYTTGMICAGGRVQTEGPMGVVLRKRWDTRERKPFLSLDNTVYFYEEVDAVTFGLYLGEFTRNIVRP